MDPVHFTGKEIFEMAIRIEENGRRYYTDAADAAGSESLRTLFRALAEEEAEHIRTFKDLKLLLVGAEKDRSFDPYAAEAALYLDALADSRVFTEADEGARLARGVVNEKDAVEVAIGMEKDSLLFYHELSAMVREKDAAVLENLITQERDHLRRLTELSRGL